MTDLKSEILKEHSKVNTLRIINWVGSDEVKIGQIVNLFLSADYRVAQRASWIISGIAERHPVLFEEHLPVVIDRMTDKAVHVAVKRNVMRLLQFVEIPDSLKGSVLDTCFAFLEDPKEGNVVQVFSMSVIEKIVIDFPEIIPEFKFIIERNLENGASPAFKSRAQKTLMRLNKRS